MNKKQAAFTKLMRLRKKKEFDSLFKESTKISQNGFLIRHRKNSAYISRLGIMIGKKKGNAVERNRIRRIVRESFRNNHADMNNSYDILVSLNENKRSQSKKEVADDFMEVFTAFLK
ncbi:MAG: ribonuclease P protein component [Spirochaetes bacterium]|nr:ribonuclease P protein component [Spirochaetota bacterium]